MKLLKQILAGVLAMLHLDVIFKLPGGLTADTTGMWGLFGFMQNVNNVMPTMVTVNSAATSVTLTAAQVLAGLIFRTGAPGGAVADTTPSAADIIASFLGTIPTDGTFQKRIRIVNSTGQTITLTAGSGVTVTGTATVADGVWREYVLNVTSGSAVSFTNIGSGSV